MTPASFVKTPESYKVCQMGHHLGSTFTETDLNTASDKFTGTDRNGPNYRIGPDCAAIAAITGFLISANLN